MPIRTNDRKRRCPYQTRDLSKSKSSIKMIFRCQAKTIPKELFSYRKTIPISQPLRASIKNFQPEVFSCQSYYPWRSFFITLTRLPPAAASLPQQRPPPGPVPVEFATFNLVAGHFNMHKIHDKPAQHKSQHLPSIVEFPPRVNACWRASISKERMLTPHFTSWKHQMHSFACAVASCKARPLPWITPQTRATTQLQEGGDQTWAGSKALTWY